MTKIPRLFELLDEKGISAKQLSDDLIISSGNISDWKSGRSSPTMEKLKQLADYFDVTVDYLLGKSDVKKPLPPDDDLADVKYAFTKLTGDPTEITEEDINDVRKILLLMKAKRKQDGKS